jgi:cytochrome c oxidase subunit I
MSAVIDSHGHDHDHDHHDHGPQAGWRRWLYATNHKDIGSMYLWFSMTMLFVGGINALLLRTELFQPGLQFMQPEFFNQLTTMHGLIMVFAGLCGLRELANPAHDRRWRYGLCPHEQL